MHSILVNDWDISHHDHKPDLKKPDAQTTVQSGTSLGAVAQSLLGDSKWFSILSALVTPLHRISACWFCFHCKQLWDRNTDPNEKLKDATEQCLSLRQPGMLGCAFWNHRLYLRSPDMRCSTPWNCLGSVLVVSHQDPCNAYSHLKTCKTNHRTFRKKYQLSISTGNSFSCFKPTLKQV